MIPTLVPTWTWRLTLRLSLAAAGLTLAPSVGAVSGKPDSDMDRALAQLQGTPQEQKKAVDFVVAHTSATPSLLMLAAAVKSLELGRLEDAAFLFFGGRLRSRYDLQRFPPVGQGGDSPGVLLAAMSQQVGAAVNPAVMSEPKAFKAVVEKLRTWDLSTPPGYDPGWPYTRAMPAAEARALAETIKQAYLGPAEGMATLLNTPEYFKAWKTLQEFNFSVGEERRKPERLAAREQAEKRLREIEETKGIEGLFYRKASSAPAPAPAPAHVTAPAERGTPGRSQAIAELKALGYPRPDDADQFVGSALQGKGDLVRLFLAAGMPVDAPNHLGDHAFLMAIQGTYIDLAAELLKAGADPNLPDGNGATPLIELSEYCDETTLVAAVIKAGGQVNAKARNGRTALKGANKAGCTAIVRMLKKAGAVQ